MEPPETLEMRRPLRRRRSAAPRHPVLAVNALVNWDLLAVVLAVEVVITLADFLEEDRTRQLPPLERWLHTVLTLSYGLFLGALAPVLLDWAAQPTAVVPHARGLVSWWHTAMAIGVWAWSLRNALAVRRLRDEPAPPVQAPPRGGDAVLVTGGTGFVGRALVARLRAEGRVPRDISDPSRGVLPGSLNTARAQGFARNLGDLSISTMPTASWEAAETRLQAPTPVQCGGANGQTVVSDDERK
mgnify:CR=1 FL=1